MRFRLPSTLKRLKKETFENGDIWKQSFLKMEHFGIRVSKTESFENALVWTVKTGKKGDIWKWWRSTSLNLPLSYYFDTIADSNVGVSFVIGLSNLI